MNLDIFDQFLLEIGIGGKEREVILTYVSHKIKSEKLLAVNDFIEYVRDNYSGNLHDMVVREYINNHLS